MAPKLPPHYLRARTFCIFVFGTEYERCMSGAVPEGLGLLRRTSEFLIMYNDDLPEEHRTCVQCLCCAIRILSDPLYFDKYNKAAYAFINAFTEIATNEYSKFTT